MQIGWLLVNKTGAGVCANFWRRWKCYCLYFGRNKLRVALSEKNIDMSANVYSKKYIKVLDMNNMLCKIAASLSVFPLLAFSSYAEKYYLSADQMTAYGADLKFSESVSFVDNSGTTQYFWYTLGEDGTTKNWCTQLPDFTDSSSTFNIGYVNEESCGFIFYSAIVDVAFNGTLTNWISASHDGVAVTTSEFSAKEIRSSAHNAKFVGTDTVVNVENIVQGRWSDPITFGCAEGSGTIKSLNVTGTFNVRGSNSYYNSIYVSNGNTSVDNPDVVINTVNGVSDGAFALLSYGLNLNQGDTFGSIKLDLVSTWQVGAFKTNSGVLAAGAADSAGALTLVLATNQAEATTTGAIWQGNFNHGSGVYSLRDGGVVVSLVVKGGKDADGNYYTQSFTGDKIAFTGGVEMISGNLRINYGVDAAYKYANYGRLTLSQAAGEQTSFGNAGEVGGTFAFSEIVVDGGGTIVAKCEGTASGGDFKVDTISLTDGGISYAEGGSGQITIDFGQGADYLAELIRGEGETSTWVKVISWVEGSTSEVEVVGALATIEKDGIEYNFESFNGSDGLYVAYVAVPEPGEVAVLFGALALVLAVWRRRK